MVDKYQHLRPARPRSCYREDRIPKKRFSHEDAWAQVAAMPEPDDYHAYECPECGWWHVGRRLERR